MLLNQENGVVFVTAQAPFPEKKNCEHDRRTSQRTQKRIRRLAKSLSRIGLKAVSSELQEMVKQKDQRSEELESKRFLVPSAANAFCTIRSYLVTMRKQER